MHSPASDPLHHRRPSSIRATRASSTVPAWALLLVVAACPAPGTSHTIEPAPASRLEIGAPPEQVGEFRLEETRQYPDPSVGTMYRYASATLRHDVFIYPITETAQRGGTDPTSQAREESQLFLATLPIQRQQGQFEAFEVVREEPLRYELPAGTVHGWHVHVLLTRRSVQGDSHQHLLVAGDRLVKVRTTFRRGSASDEAVDAFVRALLQGLIAR